MTKPMHIRNSKNTFTLCGLRYNGYKHTSMPLSSVGQLAEENRPLVCKECFDREPLYALAETELECEEAPGNPFAFYDEVSRAFPREKVLEGILDAIRNKED